MFGNVEDYGEIFQDSIFQTRGGSLSSTNQVGNPVTYKLVRVAGDGRLVPATDEEMLEVKDMLDNNENDMPILPDPILTEEYIADEGSPSQYLQLESFEGLFQSETADAYTENLNARLEPKEELMYGSQMQFTLPDTKFQISNELSGNEEQVQPEVFLQEPIRFSSNGCSMNQSMDVSLFSDATDATDATGSPKEPALSTAAPKPEFSRVAGEIRLENLSIKALQETFRATFGHESTCKDKKWLKKRIRMGRNISCVVPTTSLTISDNKLIGGGQDNCNDTIDSFGKEDEDISDCIKGHSNDLEDCPVETFVDHYSGNEDFEGEHRSAKRVRKPTRRYIEEISKIDEKQQSDESMIHSKDQRSIKAISSGGRVVVTRMVSLGGSRIQVPYVSHVRRSRPRENILALGEFYSQSCEVKATPEKSNLKNLVSGVKSASRRVQRKSDKDHLKPVFAEMDQDIMIVEPEHLESSGDSSDDNNNNKDIPIRQNAIKRKHHRAWTLSEVVKLVEGVSKYGVGKWSVIKKLSFSSYEYRTAVDIKDKWRNLQKASFAQTNSNKMAIAVPSHILLQVRELAQKQNVSKDRMVKGSRRYRFL